MNSHKQQKFATELFVPTNSSLVIKRELSGILYENYSLLLQFEKSKENSSCEIILVPKKRGNPDFLEAKKFVKDYLDKQVKQNLLNSVNPMKTKITGNNNLSKPIIHNLSINEVSKRNFLKTTLANSIKETVSNMKTSIGPETVAMVNKIEKMPMTKISSYSRASSPEPSSDTKSDGKSFAVHDSKGLGPQKWRNPLLGCKPITKDTSQERVSALKFVQTQLTSDNHSGSKLPIPLVIDMKSSNVNAKENVNSKDEDECVVIVKEVEKNKDASVSSSKRKRDKFVRRNTNEKCEDITNDSVIIIDDEPENIECKKRRCSLNDSVIIVEDTNSKHTRKRHNRSSTVLGLCRMKEKNKGECKSLSIENGGKQLRAYESVLKKDFIPLSSCASVVTYVNKCGAFAEGSQEGKKSDAVQSHMFPVYIDKDKNLRSSTAFQQSTSQNFAPQQQQPPPQPTPVGGNICTVKKKAGKQTGLRPIVIDGSNVAMGHTNGRVFSCEGLKICIDYFLERKHKVIAFVPRFRQGKCTNLDLLSTLEKRGLVTFTPSRRVNGKLLVSYDDRFIVQYAAECGGVIVSTDNFRDLLNENSNWKETIEKRLLMFTWAGDVLMFPHDPLGRGGPTLEELLRFPD